MLAPSCVSGCTLVRVETDQVAAYRLRANHLHERLRAGSYADAAYGGLQDSAPRASLIALHARVERTHPDAWEDPSLVQIWFRWADYVVPRRDVGVFTLGASPRDEQTQKRRGASWPAGFSPGTARPTTGSSPSGRACRRTTP